MPDGWWPCAKTSAHKRTGAYICGRNCRMARWANRCETSPGIWEHAITWTPRFMNRAENTARCLRAIGWMSQHSRYNIAGSGCQRFRTGERSIAARASRSLLSPISLTGTRQCSNSIRRMCSSHRPECCRLRSLPHERRFPHGHRYLPARRVRPLQPHPHVHPRSRQRHRIRPHPSHRQSLHEAEIYSRSRKNIGTM